MAALQYSEYYLVTTIYSGFSGVTTRGIAFSFLLPQQMPHRAYSAPAILVRLAHRKIIARFGPSREVTYDLMGVNCDEKDGEKIVSCTTMDLQLWV